MFYQSKSCLSDIRGFLFIFRVTFLFLEELGFRTYNLRE